MVVWFQNYQWYITKINSWRFLGYTKFNRLQIFKDPEYFLFYGLFDEDMVKPAVVIDNILFIHLAGSHFSSQDPFISKSIHQLYFRYFS